MKTPVQAGICALFASGWIGCSDTASMDLAEPASAVEQATTSGVQTPRPLPNGTSLGYYEYLPAGYETGAQFPLIVFFHGIGERGNGSTELGKVLKWGPPELINDNLRQFPAIVISPQLPTSSSTWSNAITSPFVDYLLSHYHVDRSRIYITGLSLGGGGTWTYAKHHPTTVAAIVPICGTRDETGYGPLHDMPIWTFHRISDTVVPISAAVSILTEVTGVAPSPQAGFTGYFGGTAWDWRTGEAAPKIGEHPTFTVYPGSAHDEWIPAYNSQAMWDWLFSQHLPSIVLQQDFQSSTSITSYVSPAPTPGQFNDISAEANGGIWSIDQGRLKLVRTGSSTADNAAGITRWTDFEGPPALLHLTFDVGVSGWTSTPFQSGAMGLSIGSIAGFSDYSGGGVAAATFHAISVKGEGVGQFSVMSAAAKSALLPADGTLQHVALFLNKSGAAASYRAPDQSLRSLRDNGAALWVNGAPVVIDDVAANGASSALTDLRIKWSNADNGTWLLDNLFIEGVFPQ
jgi:pimeloyl-ACP methyl ester carboxylesterase